MTNISTIDPNALIPTLCSPAGNQLGESVTYDGAEDMLYWVDIPQSKIHLLNGGKHESLELQVHPGFVALLESGDIIAGGDRSLLLHKDGESRLESIPGCEIGEVVNDGVVSPDGRSLVFGTSDENEEEAIGRMMVVTEAEIIIYPYNFTVFNGPAFSSCGGVIYFADTLSGIIWRADFDSNRGVIGERTCFSKVPSQDGYPDGMCIDDEGCLWSAHWDGSRLTRYNAAGAVDVVLPMPVIRPTSVVFGGPSGNTLYVTSAMADDCKLRRKTDGIADGDLLSVVMPVTGPPSAKLKFNPLDTLTNGQISYAS